MPFPFFMLRRRITKNALLAPAMRIMTPTMYDTCENGVSGVAEGLALFESPVLGVTPLAALKLPTLSDKASFAIGKVMTVLAGGFPLAL